MRLTDSMLGLSGSEPVLSQSGKRPETSLELGDISTMSSFLSLGFRLGKTVVRIRYEDIFRKIHQRDTHCYEHALKGQLSTIL